MARGAYIQIVGLKGFVRNLRQADADLPKAMRRGLNAIASQIIAPEIQAGIRSSIKRSAGHGLAGSVRAQSNQREGRVIIGYANRVKHAGWWIFGGSTKSPRGNTYRERVPGGRVIQPTMERVWPEVVKEMESLMNRLQEEIEA